MKKLNWTILGAAAYETVSLREDFKFIKIGKDLQEMSKASIEELQNTPYSELLRVCIMLFNKERSEYLED